LNRLIRELNDAGTTIIFSTHILHQAEQICDRIFLIHKGEKLLDATLDEIRAQFDPRTVLVEPLKPGFDFSAIPGVHDVRLLANGPASELELQENIDPQEIMRSIIERVAIRTVELRRLSLDEVFVRLVMQDSGEGEAAAAREQLGHG
jgi:ABC-2 type transport system ATP-binding protein